MWILSDTIVHCANTSSCYTAVGLGNCQIQGIDDGPLDILLIGIYFSICLPSHGLFGPGCIRIHIIVRPTGCGLASVPQRVGPGSTQNPHGTLCVSAYIAACSTIPRYPCSSDCWEGYVHSTSIKASTNARMLDALGRGCMVGRFTNLAEISMKSTGGGTIFSGCCCS